MILTLSTLHDVGSHRIMQVKVPYPGSKAFYENEIVHASKDLFSSFFSNNFTEAHFTYIIQSDCTIQLC